MGKLSHDLHIQHFSHPHLLELTNIQALNLNPCSACNLQSSGWMYTCRPCNFTLHTSCSQLPHLITHPAHPGHSLSLLPAPAYPVGYFNCDACGQRGHGFNYHCNQCDFDIHSIGSNHWLYRCSICEFDVHMSCVNTAANIYKGTTRQGNVQFQAWDSFPGSAQNNLQYRNGGAPMNYQYQNNGAAAGNGLMGVAVQGFVEGAAQQVGQNLVQSLMGGGDDSNNGGDNNSSSSSASMVDVGSSLLSGMFGNS
ncbi:hypothetical protein E1A91_A07G245900v1 [Gossypium mustelinum]|uniref:DC1 domain-containing protein n=1 Tax=Gossypium mustelinum TaxID=34275 RepID=A0A5D2YP74_GOSMU|nr:hypothetical protein E1A91_A07G245900v1 [Gossypium mustelinum]